MEQKIPGKSDISEKLDDLERLTKIFEMNVAEKTVLFDCRPKISEFFFQMDRALRNHDGYGDKTSPQNTSLSYFTYFTTISSL